MSMRKESEKSINCLHCEWGPAQYTPQKHWKGRAWIWSYIRSYPLTGLWKVCICSLHPCSQAFVASSPCSKLITKPANWWKENFHGENFCKLLAGVTKRCHAPTSTKTIREIATKPQILWNFPAIQYNQLTEAEVHDLVVCLWMWATGTFPASSTLASYPARLVVH